MLNFPLWYIAAPFLLAIAVWVFFTIINIYHTLRFGYINYISYFMTFILIGGAVIILFLTAQNLNEIDWYEPITFRFLTQQNG